MCAGQAIGRAQRGTSAMWVYNRAMVESMDNERVTIRTLRRWAKAGEPIAMLTCYDATTARLLWDGGVRCMLVGDTAGQVILGHDNTLGTPLGFLVELTAAVRRGAPDAFVMADMPFGSYQCGADRAVRNAIRFLREGNADAVKLEVGASDAALVGRLSDAGVPVVAHLGSRPQRVLARGGYGSVGRTARELAALRDEAREMVTRGAAMLLIEAVPAEVAAGMIEAANEAADQAGTPRPVVIGCGAGPACHGHVVVLQDLLGMTPWQPPFAKPAAAVGAAIRDAASKWCELVASGEYLRGDHPYRMRDGE